MKDLMIYLGGLSIGLLGGFLIGNDYGRKNMNAEHAYMFKNINEKLKNQNKETEKHIEYLKKEHENLVKKYNLKEESK